MPGGKAVRSEPTGGGIPGAVGNALTAALDLLLPHRCMACGTLVDAAGLLCKRCWSGVEFAAPPWCVACGLPFEYEIGEGAVCGACARKPPPFARARGAVLYNAASRRLVLAYKHGDRIENAPAFARWMARAGADLIADADLVVPVPLHWTRLFSRRYNQAALLARAVARHAELTYAPGLLVRRKRAPSQGRLGRSARLRNVAGSFAVPPRVGDALRGKRVLLVDDVITTGATVASCSRALLRGGAAAVDVLAFARVAAPAL